MAEGLNLCNICQEPLVTEAVSQEMECHICHKVLTTDMHCLNGHFICDKCHAGSCLEAARAYCETCTSRNPFDIVTALCELPAVHFRGPEHHVFVGFALLTAAHNSGASLEWPRVLEIFQTRCAPYPGGSCCRWGCCGAAVGAGTAVSVMLKTTGDSDLPWHNANAMTAQALTRIANEGGPSCCRRSTFAAISEGAKFWSEQLNIPIEIPETITCTYFEQNTRCRKEKCPYYPHKP